MDEIIRNKKVVKMSPGFDYATGDLRMYRLTNTILSGVTGSGIDNVVNSILANLVTFTSPTELQIEMIVPNEVKRETNPWLNDKRRIPHFSFQERDNGKLWRKLEELAMIISEVELFPHDDLEYGNKELWGEVTDLRNEVTLIVLDLTAYKLTKHQIDLIKYLLRVGTCYNVFLLIITDKPEIFSDCMDEIPTRLFTRGSEEMSNTVLGCNCGARNDSTHGYVWISHEDYPYEFKRLKTKFYPLTYVGKLCKILSTSNEVKINSFYTKWVNILRSGDFVFDDIAVGRLLKKKYGIKDSAKEIRKCELMNQEELLKYYVDELLTWEVPDELFR